MTPARGDRQGGRKPVGGPDRPRDTSTRGKDLGAYRDKRDFARTPEPPPGAPDGPGRGADARPVFVVHRHDARRLHYDLRLEMDGALTSWAVPKGFSYDPSDKRLAVHTEDHPMEYEHFHGVIPPGQYGAGTMTIWDRGRYELLHADAPREALAAGEVKLLLSGRRLRGEWHLVRTRAEEDHWLLFKSKDRYAGPPRDSVLGIDLAAAVERDLPRRVRLAEPAGTAPLADPGWVHEMGFVGRRLLAEKRGDDVRLRGLRRSLDAWPALAAELSALRADTALLDGVLLALDPSGRPDARALAARLAGDEDVPLFYYAFDLLHWDDLDLRPLPLRDRKSGLRAILPVGATALQYVDHVAGDGAGLLDAVRDARLPGVVSKRVDAPYPSGPSADWGFTPAHDDAGGDGTAGGGAAHEGARSASAGAPDTTLHEALAERTKGRGPRVRVTNPGKVYWPAEGFTKADLVAYYDRIAEVLLPHLADRPVHMNRFPDGIEGESFYQRQAYRPLPDWVETEPIESTTGRHEEAVPHVLCNSRATLLWMANLGSIDLHPWLSRRGHLDEPDVALIDLDPKDAPFGDVVRIARATGRLLHGIGLRPVLKTSGKTGLHIAVPLQPGYDYEQSRMFCELVARQVCRELPEIATVERVPSARGGKVYVDFLQNRRSQTVVPPYSVRPVPGASVSTPLHWDELDGDLHPSHHTILSVPARVEELGDLYRGALDDPQDLMPALAALDEQLRG